MPDLARSTSEMLEEMKKIVQQPEGNHHHHHHRTGLILTKNPVARKDSNFISVVPIVLLSSLCFYCTC